MNIEKGELKDGVQSITVTLSNEEFQPYVETTVKELAKSVKVDGFREGEAPYNVLKQKIGEMRILEHAAERAVQKTYLEALKDIDIKKAAGIDPSVVKLAPDNDFVYTIAVTLWPDVELGDFSKVSIQKKEIVISEDEITKVLHDLQKVHAKEILMTREVQKGDKVEVDAEIKLNNVVIEGGTLKKYPFVIGEGMMIPGFEDQLIGMKADQSKTFKLTFPKEYHGKHVAGKECVFDVKLINVYHRSMPDLNDEFAKMAANKETLVELKDEIKERLSSEKQKEVNDTAQRELMEELIKKTKYGIIPEILITRETQKMEHELKHQVERMGLKYEDYLANMSKTSEQIKLDMAAEAMTRLKAGLLIEEILKQENITVEDKEITEFLESVTAQYKEEEKKKIMDNKEYREHARNQLMSQKVTKHLSDKYIKA